MTPPQDPQETNPEVNATLEMCKGFLHAILNQKGISGAAIVLSFEDPAVQSVGVWRTKTIDISALANLVRRDATFHLHLTNMLVECIEQATQEKQ